MNITDSLADDGDWSGNASALQCVDAQLQRHWRDIADNLAVES